MKNAKITIGLIGLLLIGLVSVRKEGKVQEAGLLLQNVEALATGESFPDGDIACIGDGSVDCPFTYLNTRFLFCLFTSTLFVLLFIISALYFIKHFI